MKTTQVDIAKALGVTARHINRIYRKKAWPSVSLAKKIELITGIPWTSWFDDKPAPEAKNGR